MFLLLFFVLFSLFIDVLALAPCPLPEEVPPSEYPSTWIRGGDMQFKTIGTEDWFECRTGDRIYYIGQLGPSSNAFTCGRAFRCNTTTLKWVDPTNGFEAPPFFNCGYPGGDFTYCNVKHRQDDAVLGDLAIYPGLEQYCPIGQTVEFDDGRAVANMKCEDSGLSIEAGDGTVTFHNRSNIAVLKCVPVFCTIKIKSSNGTVVNANVTYGKESSFCKGFGSAVQFSHGARINNIQCDRTGLHITAEDGADITYQKSTPPTLECLPGCLFLKKNSDGTKFLVGVHPGKEQSCPAGQIFYFADGSPIYDMKCSEDGLAILGDSGTKVYKGLSYPTLMCGPGVCTKMCAAPTTTTTVAITTTIPAHCPPEGVWSEWVVSGQCASTCGAYNVAARKRTCTDKCGQNCPCVGPSEDVGPCGITLCTFPNPTCKAPYKKSLNSNTNALFCGEDNIPKTVCPLETTTTTTAAPTTTTPKDVPPTAAQLWNVKYYYNAARILHAFCADQACINVIQANGIGYDLSTYSGLVGRAIREDAINAVRTACPTGSAKLANLGFTRVGNHYEHNLSGIGLKQGWVATEYGACGATVGIKRWKCHLSEDMQYEVDLEGNEWYTGLVQDNGKVQFYMY